MTWTSTWRASVTRRSRNTTGSPNERLASPCVRSRATSLVGGLELAGAAAGATTTGFDDQRVADGLCVTAGVLAGRDGATAPRCERNAHLLGQSVGLHLFAQGAHRGRRRPDEGELQALAELCEGDVFGDETPAHPHRVGPGLPQRALPLSVVEVDDGPRS